MMALSKLIPMELNTALLSSTVELLLLIVPPLWWPERWLISILCWLSFVYLNMDHMCGSSNSISPWSSIGMFIASLLVIIPSVVDVAADVESFSVLPWNEDDGLALSSFRSFFIVYHFELSCILYTTTRVPLTACCLLGTRAEMAQIIVESYEKLVTRTNYLHVETYLK